MRWILASLGVIVLAGAAQAGPLDADRSSRADRGAGLAETPSPARASARVERLDDDADGLDLDLPVSLALPHWRPEHREERYDPRLEAALPEGLSISVRLHPALRVYVAADLDAELPRLDALDGETYFMPGVELALTRELRVFVEDFQPAGMIVADADEAKPAPERSWDGHQVALGARLSLGDRVEVEAAAVGYVLSAFNRPAGVGAAASLTVRF